MIPQQPLLNHREAQGFVTRSPLTHRNTPADSVRVGTTLMNTACVRGKHLALRDERAPYRGKWMICTDTDGLYWALHETTDDGKTLDVVEERSFKERREASRFVRHLVLHGWSVYECPNGPGSVGLLW